MVNDSARIILATPSRDCLLGLFYYCESMAGAFNELLNFSNFKNPLNRALCQLFSFMNFFNL